MSTHEGGMRAALAALLVAASAGCFAHGEPPMPLGRHGTAGPGGPGGDGYGAWVVIRTGSGRADVIAGELIVCRIDSLWVLTEGGLRSAALERVRSVRLYAEFDGHGRVREVDVVPADEASIVGPPDGSIARAREADLRPWARYPQGWPPGLDPSALRPKPATQP